MRLLLLFLLMVGCGPAVVYTTPTYVESSLQSMVEEFDRLTEDYPKHSVDVIKRGALPVGKLGNCRVTFSKQYTYRVVTVSEELSGTRLRWVVYHELVHCAIGHMEHTPGTLMDAYVPWDLPDPEGALLDYLRRHR